jgi:hypothetical protein
VLLLYRVWGGNMSTTKWEAQERDAVRLLREFLATTFGVDVSAEDARFAGDLARDQYPRGPAEAATLGALIERLAGAHVTRIADDPADIRNDAGVRLWLLSALALKRASPVSLSLAAKALSTSPTSLVSFAAKVASRLAAKRSFLQ